MSKSISLYQVIGDAQTDSDIDKMKNRFDTVETLGDPASLGSIPSVYSLVQQRVWSNQEYIALLSRLTTKGLPCSFWTSELTAYLKSAAVNEIYYPVIQLMRSQGALMLNMKEIVLMRIKSMPVMEQLTLIDSVLSQQHALFAFFSIQRNRWPTSMNRGTFKALAEHRKHLKEDMIAYFRTLPADQQFHKIQESLKSGTALNRLFMTRRGFFSSPAITKGTMATLVKMKADLIPKLFAPTTNPLQQRLNEIGFSEEPPEELVCCYSMEIMNDPIRLPLQKSSKVVFCSRAQIDQWFKVNKGEPFVCPYTQESLPFSLFYSAFVNPENAQHRRRCEQFVEAQEVKFSSPAML